MDWSQRGHDKSYDSLNGNGALIGFLTGKFVNYKTRKRKCNKCSIDSDDCRISYV